MVNYGYIIQIAITAKNSMNYKLINKNISFK